MMENREELQQKADDKLLGRLQDEAKFGQELANDPALAEILADTQLAMSAIEAAEDAAMKARLQSLETNLAKQQKTNTLKIVKDSGEGKVIPIRPPFWRRNLAAIAAAAAILLSVGYFLLMPDNQTDTTELFAANFEPYPNIAVDLTRSNAPSPEEIAFTAYENGDYRQAIDMIEALDKQPAYQFYLAQAQLAQDDYSSAESLLFTLAKQDDFPLAKEANWYLALAQLGSGKKDATINRLETIVADDQHPFQEKATELLAELAD